MAKDNEFQVDGKKFPVRGLKRKEVKKLNKDGFSLMCIMPQTVEALMEQVLDVVLTGEQQALLDECDFKESLNVWRRILELTLGALPSEIKN